MAINKHKIVYASSLVGTILLIWAVGIISCFLFGYVIDKFIAKLPDQPNAHYESSRNVDYSPLGGYVRE